ncbi:unnamed protein product, partial [Adineta ricciae]
PYKPQIRDPRPRLPFGQSLYVNSTGKTLIHVHILAHTRTLKNLSNSEHVCEQPGSLSCWCSGSSAVLLGSET